MGGPYFWTFKIFCSHPPNQLSFELRNGNKLNFAEIGQRLGCAQQS